MSNMPVQKPGKSEQVVCTPPEFLEAVKERLGIKEFAWDLAASEENKVAPLFYSEKDNAIIRSWDKGDWCWCNPPYANLAHWTHKASVESGAFGAYVAMLVPASTGANWWAEYVNNKAYVTYLNGRITFVGHDSPYPKDLALLLYAPFLRGGSCIWRWK